MKKIQLNLWLLAIIMVLIACPTEVERGDVEHIIENATDYEVNIKFYKRTINYFYFIPETSGVLKKGERISGVKGLSNLKSIIEYKPSHTFKGDSVRIILNNKKLIIHNFVFKSIHDYSFSEPANRNIFKHSNYENIGNDKYRYKITKEDYKNAIDCDGDCE